MSFQKKVGHSVGKDNGGRHTSTTSSVLLSGVALMAFTDGITKGEKSGKYLLMSIIPWSAIYFRLHFDVGEYISLV